MRVHSRLERHRFLVPGRFDALLDRVLIVGRRRVGRRVKGRRARAVRLEIARAAGPGIRRIARLSVRKRRRNVGQARVRRAQAQLRVGIIRLAFFASAFSFRVRFCVIVAARQADVQRGMVTSNRLRSLVGGRRRRTRSRNAVRGTVEARLVAESATAEIGGGRLRRRRSQHVGPQRRRAAVNGERLETDAGMWTQVRVAFAAQRFALARFALEILTVAQLVAAHFGVAVHFRQILAHQLHRGPRQAAPQLGAIFHLAAAVVVAAQLQRRPEDGFRAATGLADEVKRAGSIAADRLLVGHRRAAGRVAHQLRRVRHGRRVARRADPRD